MLLEKEMIENINQVPFLKTKITKNINTRNMSNHFFRDLLFLYLFIYFTSAFLYTKYKAGTITKQSTTYNGIRNVKTPITFPPISHIRNSS